ncbi:arginine/agmatine antiporter [Microbulbifer sp. MLAF003]|uniref:arginine/agmatine antiporter n=1 Tax=unclassified Microbulbifer TaxID=2619833 RepID=UPI0024AE0808|nr:arginine/agmatine antiporter [Microbulbifer sp. MLAF003]WHI53452.1 arginine/agmatine antiporter [Microbulbifer sp. MLAF003]
MAQLPSEVSKISLLPATLMVAGNMMGSGVFMLPANLAVVGSISLIGWLVTVVGAVALALVFARLAALDPAAGGPYAYARKAFGDYIGYQTNLVYWLANVIGNVALITAGLGYITHFFPPLKDPLTFALAQVALIWLLTYANILGPRTVGRIQSLTTSLVLIPILGTAIFGWFWFDSQTFSSSWNVSGKSDISAVMTTLTFTLWAFIGVETASVSAAVVKNPTRNVPIATVGGVLIASVAYVLSSSVIMGMVPNKELLASSAPFADAARLALGNTAANIVAICAAIGCIGSLGGWILLVGQSAKAASDDGLFASIFARTNNKGVPSAGLTLVAILMSLLVLATISPSASQQFGKIASVAVIMTLLPYIYSAVALKILAYGKMPHHEYSIFTVILLIAAVYCLIALVGSNAQQTRWSLIFVITTVIFYALILNRRRSVEEKHLLPGGPEPAWVHYFTLTVTIGALCIFFWISVGQYKNLDLRLRAPQPIERLIHSDHKTSEST